MQSSTIACTGVVGTVGTRKLAASRGSRDGNACLGKPGKRGLGVVVFIIIYLFIYLFTYIFTFVKCACCYTTLALAVIGHCKVKLYMHLCCGSRAYGKACWPAERFGPVSAWCVAFITKETKSCKCW